MKTKRLLAMLLASTSLALTGCGGEGGGGEDGPTGGQSITVDPIAASELGIDEQYTPSKKDIKQLSGEITVALDYEGRDAGWRKVADEYERLQSNNVKINIKADVAGTQYTTKLNEMLQDVINGGTSEWDIVEGNLGYSRTHRTCIDFHTMIREPNAWCGASNQKWEDVLTRQAYYNYDSDTTWGQHYILNTENMQSAWFVNDVALEATKTVTYEKIDGTTATGYTNARGELAGYPVVWDDLINLCRAMQAAGYTNPLGITLSESSLKSLQFTWLLRIYGDYYYRQFYEWIMNTSDLRWIFDPSAKCPELTDGFGVKHSKILNLLFDENTEYGPGYVGFKSEVYKDFVANLYKMRGLFIENATSTDFGEVRSQFMLQSKGKSSAQIVLDYLGQGLQYIQYENANLKLGYFDYPQMQSGEYTSISPANYGHAVGDKIVPEGYITRDIGGNGGFVSIVEQRSNPNKTAISKDFLKFFLSPYGQSIYYKALEETESHISPKGLTTVRNNLVKIPQVWKTFFRNAEEAGVEFNGNVDPNTFISYGVRYFQGYQKSETAILNWQKLLVLGSKKYDIEAFCGEWHQACFDDYQEMSADSDHGWPVDMYLHPTDGRY